MFEISRDTMISEILTNAPEAMPVFQNDVDPDEFLEQLRTYLESL